VKDMVYVLRSILRFVCVGTVFFTVLLSLGAGFINSLVAGLTAFVFVTVGLGTMVIQRLALWSAILLIVDRAGLLPLTQWFHGLITIIGTIISRGLA